VGINVLLTVVLKKINGRPRPNFFAMCGYPKDATTG
jgi:hypothetical protein